MGKGHISGGPSGDYDEGAVASAVLVGAVVTIILFVLVYKLYGIG